MEKAVDVIGFRPPTLYLQLLQNIGNGGFGPGYGLLGLIGGAADDRGKTAVGLLKDFAEPDPDDPAWDWPNGLLPICHWGCGIYSCIDCTSEQVIVMTWDPNEWDVGTSPKLAIRTTEMPMLEWLQEWADGADLWKKMFPTP